VQEFNGETLNHVERMIGRRLVQELYFFMLIFSGWRYTVPPMDDWLMLGADPFPLLISIRNEDNYCATT
jgi:hypothetical protein